MRNAFTFASAVLLGTASAQISNGGFEAVIVPFDPEMPTLAYNWAFASAYGESAVGDAHSGDHALSVWNWYWYAEGYATNGISTLPGADGLPVAGSPDQLTGWFKRVEGDLESSEGDQARVRVLMTRWNTTAGQRDTVGFGEHLFDEQATWVPFTLDIAYTSVEAPDTVVIQIASCVSCQCIGPSTGECAYFVVDDLALISTTGIRDALMDNDAVRLLPQADGNAIVRVAAHTPLPLRLQLWDALGRRIGDLRVNSDGQRIALPSIPGVVVFDASARERSLARGRVLVH